MCWYGYGKFPSNKLAACKSLRTRFSKSFHTKPVSMYRSYLKIPIIRDLSSDQSLFCTSPV